MIYRYGAVIGIAVAYQERIQSDKRVVCPEQRTACLLCPVMLQQQRQPVWSGIGADIPSPCPSLMIGRGGYADPDNKSLPERNKKQKYVSQTLELLGLTTDKDIWIDYSIYDMMDLYEKRYGEVKLSEYDFATDLMERYEPMDEKPSTSGMLRLVLYPRNEYVVRRIVDSQRPRIAVIYGSGHMPGIKYYLKKHGFRPTRGYKADKQSK